MQYFFFKFNIPFLILNLDVFLTGISLALKTIFKNHIKIVFTS